MRSPEHRRRRQRPHHERPGCGQVRPALPPKGQWKGQQLVPADWVETSTSAQNNGAGDGTGSYGFQWWIRQFNGYDGYSAFGAWGQYIIVIPELELVCVIASPGPQSSYASRAYFTDYVLKALLED